MSNSSHQPASSVDEDTKTTGLLIVISGPSGVGKGTICQALLQQHPSWQWSVSATSRTPRPGETHGEDYWFYTPSQFETLITEGGLFEWAEYNGNYYGTPIQPVEDTLANGATLLMEIDVQGALQVKEKLPQAKLIMLLPPDRETLAARLQGRGTNTNTDIQQRLAIATDELAQQHQFNVAIPNHTIEQCTRDVAQWIDQH